MNATSEHLSVYSGGAEELQIIQAGRVTFRVTRPLRVTETWRSQTRERVKGRVHAVVRARRNMILDH